MHISWVFYSYPLHTVETNGVCSYEYDDEAIEYAHTKNDIHLFRFGKLLLSIKVQNPFGFVLAHLISIAKITFFLPCIRFMRIIFIVFVFVLRFFYGCNRKHAVACIVAFELICALHFVSPIRQ